MAVGKFTARYMPNTSLSAVLAQSKQYMNTISHLSSTKPKKYYVNYVPK